MNNCFKKFCAATGASLFLSGIGALGGNANLIEVHASAVFSPVVENTGALNFSPELMKIFEEAGIEPLNGHFSAWRETPTGSTPEHGVFRAAGQFSWDRPFTGTVWLVNGNSEVAGSRRSGTTTNVQGAFVQTGRSDTQARGSMTAR